ncbi:MAG: histidine kinase [Fibrobacteres bacterium]|nr:histidine kinase [Fibrobacterota bacterium]
MATAMLRLASAASAILAILGSVAPLSAQGPEWLLFRDYTSIISQTQDGDTSWILTTDGLVKLVLGTGKASLPEDLPGSSGPDWSRVEFLRTLKGGRKCALQKPMDLWTWADGKWTLHRPAGNRIAAQSANDLACGEDGSAWIATWEGVVRFQSGDWSILNPGLDNPDYANYPPSGQSVEGIRLDAEGVPHILTEGYVAGLREGRFVPEFRRNGYHLSMNDAMGRSRALDLACAPDGSMFVAAGDALYRMEKDGLTWKRIPYDPADTSATPAYGRIKTRTLLSAGLEGVWVGSSGGMFRFADGKWARSGEGLASPVGTRITSLVVDGSGRAWAGTPQGLYFRDASSGDQGAWNPHPLFPGSTALRGAKAFAATGDGKVWAATGDLRLSVFDGKLWNHADSVESGINRLAADTSGIFTWDGSKWTRIPFPGPMDRDFYPLEIRQLAIGKDHKVWALQGRSAYRRDGDSWKAMWTAGSNVNPALFPNGMPSRMEFGPDGRLFLAAEGSLGIYDGTVWKLRFPGNAPLSGERIDALLVDAAGNAWIGTESGSSVYRQGGVIAARKRAQGGILTVTPGIPRPGRGMAIGSAAVAGAAWHGREFSADGRRLPAAGLRPLRAPVRRPSSSTKGD